MDAKKLIEFVQKGMNAQAAIDKVLADHKVSEAVDPYKLGRQAAKTVLKKMNLQPRGRQDAWREIDGDKVEKIAGNLEVGIDADDQDTIDDFFDALWTELDKLGYKDDRS